MSHSCLARSLGQAYCSTGSAGTLVRPRPVVVLLQSETDPSDWRVLWRGWASPTATLTVTFNATFWAKQSWPKMLKTVCAYWREVDSSLTVMLKNPINSAAYFAAEHRAAVYDTVAMEIHNHIHNNLPAWMFEEYVHTVHEVLGQPAMLCGRPGAPYKV